jgi:1-acyl-sn-glycerol-3-phosphate acyltransferase
MKASLHFRAARALLRLLLGIVLRVHVEGSEQLPKGRYVLACNHLNWVDPFLLVAWLPASPRLHFLGRRSAIYNRFWKRWTLAFIGGVIPVESGQLREVSVAVGDVLRQGGVVALFPEGGVGSVEGALQPLRSGVGHFAADNGVTVVAVGLAGTLELWRGKRIYIRVGAIVQPSGALDDDMTAIEAAMLAALPPYRDPGGRRPWPWMTTLLR